MQANLSDVDLNLNKLKFRRQFILGPARMEIIPSWERVLIQNNLCLSVHPDLELYQAARENKSLILLGYILDPNAPEADNDDILKDLIDKFNKVEDIFNHINDYGGRWVLLVNDGQETILLHDAAGLRQIYYAAADTVWCASETGLLANILNLHIDSEAEALTKSEDYRISGVYWWPGDTSMYKEVRALLPNHYLNIQSGTPHRYWPNEKIKSLSLQEGVAKSAQILRALIKSAHLRYELALSCTAGWDSRLMLAVCKEAIEDLYCFTLTYPNYNKNTPDLVIPALLLKKLGMKLNVIRYAENIPPEFEKIFRESIVSIDPEDFADIQSMSEKYPQSRLCISGDVAEITKCYYRTEDQTYHDIDAHTLTDITKMGKHPFALKAYEKWLSTANAYNVNLLDLLCWEQMAGRWQARIRGKYDLVHESFAPYNCRTLLETMLAVEEKFRQPPLYEFHKELIASLWSEVLSEPINPPEKKSLKTILRDILVKINVYQLIPGKLIKFVKKFID